MVNVTIERDVGVEMRDGVELKADVYRPEEGPHPTLLARTPYDKNELSLHTDMLHPLDAVEQGFAVVFQDCRGRFASDGEWEPYFCEGPDGYDTVEWIAEQPWCNGRVGITGASYVGVTTWQTVIADPPHLEAALPLITAGNLHNGWTYTGGAFEFGFNHHWTTTALAGGALDFLDVSEEQLQEWLQEYVPLFDDLPERMRDLPMTDVSIFEDLAPYYQEWLEHPSYDEYWEQIDVTKHVDSISVPILEIGGWYDKFTRGHFDTADAIDAAADESIRENHHLVFGPWEHLTQFSLVPNVVGERDFGVASVMPEIVDELMLPWFAYHLQDADNEIADLPRVRYFQMGDDEWRVSNEWPPATDSRTYYLDSDGAANTRTGDGQLTEQQQPDSRSRDSYLYDPLDPVPTRGGNTLMQPAGDPGVKDQSNVELRDDVLVYTTPRLTEPVSVLGRPEVTLFAASSAPDTDFTGKLVDVEPDGYCANISEGILRARYRNSMADPEFMEPGETYEVTVELWPTAHTFQPGHRIRLEVSSSNFPRFDRNPNVAIPVAEATQDDMQTATNQILHGSEHPSKLTLPTIEN